MVSSRPRQVMTTSVLALLCSMACRMSACQPQSGLPAREGCQSCAGGDPGLLAAVLRSHLLTALLLGWHPCSKLHVEPVGSWSWHASNLAEDVWVGHTHRTQLALPAPAEGVCAVQEIDCLVRR